MASMLKQRLIGAAVLIALGVIFIPMLLTGDGKFLSEDMESNVPPKPMYELEVPKVLPLDKRELQSSDPVIEPATQTDTQADKKQTDENQGEKMANAGSDVTANKEPEAVAPATKAPAVSAEPKTSESKPAEPKSSEPSTANQNEPEKTASAPAAEKPVVTEAAKESTKKPIVSGWAVQLGSFSVQKNAVKLRDSLRKKGYASFVEESTQNGKTSYRVRVGPELTRELADDMKKKLKAETKIDGFVVTFPAK